MSAVKETSKNIKNAPTTPNRQWVALGVALAVPFVAAAIGGRATGKSVNTWYRTLRKPAWNPPGWVFGPVWTVLYTMMGIASWQVWRSGNGPTLEDNTLVEPAKKRVVNGALALYGVHLGFNVFWSVLFFGQRNIKWALAEIFVLWALIAATLVRFYRIKPEAGLLLVPYLLWSTFAAVLNATIWRMNRGNLLARLLQDLALRLCRRSIMALVDLLNELAEWPVLKQLWEKDPLALGETAFSQRSKGLQPRTKTADKVVPSICPYCAVGCGQLIYVKDEKIIDIEGDPNSPISRGCLCPKGAATFQLVTGSHRVNDVLYRRPYAKEWEKIPLEQALEMVAARVKKTRDEHWEAETNDGHPLRRTLGIAHLGGATLDNEENYLIKKLFTGLGVVQVENQARI